MSTAAQRLADLGLVLPPPLPAFGRYVPAVLDGTALHVGGHFGLRDDGALWSGKLGGTLSLEDGQAAARSAALHLLATVQDVAGSLDRVHRVVSVLGVVNATSDFTDHTAVIDAASALLVDVLGERGQHARLAVGVASLPADLALEITAVVRLTEEPAAAG